MQSIYKFDAGNGLSQVTSRGLKTYTYEYPENYESTIKITQYSIGNDEFQNMTRAITTAGNAIGGSMGLVGTLASLGANLVNKVRGSTQVPEKPIVEYTLYRAFPHRLSSLQTDWASQNQYHSLPVHFHFQSWSSNFVSTGSRFDSGATYLPQALDVDTAGTVKTGVDAAAAAVTSAASATGSFISDVAANPLSRYGGPIGVSLAATAATISRL